MYAQDGALGLKGCRELVLKLRESKPGPSMRQRYGIPKIRVNRDGPQKDRGVEQISRVGQTRVLVPIQ